MRPARLTLHILDGLGRNVETVERVSNTPRNVSGARLEPPRRHAVERVQCPGCHSTVGFGLVYAAGNACPNCATPLCVKEAPCEPSSSPLAHGGARRAWGRARYLAEVRRSLAWADECAERGDRAGALGWLQMIEALDEPLPHEYEVKGAAWRSALERPVQPLA